MKLFRFNNKEEKSPEDELDELEQQQVCIIQGSNFVLTFLENETDFFDDVTSALHNDVLKIRGRQSDYLLSVLLNSIMGNYIATVSTIDDSLEDLEEELLTISDGNDIGIQIQALRRQYMLMEESHSSIKGTIRETPEGGKLPDAQSEPCFLQRCQRPSAIRIANHRNMPGNPIVPG